MRTLTSTLTAAQKTLQVLRPAILLDVSDRPVEVPRWDWSVVSNEGVTACHGAACQAADGGVVRVRVTAAGALQVNRIADFGAGPWASWTTLASGYNTTAQAGIGATTDDGTVVIAYVSGDGLSLYVRVSSDYGATWGGEATRETVPGGMSYRGVSLGGASGKVYIAYTIRTGGGTDTLTVNRYATSTGWAAAFGDSIPNDVTGCGCLVEGTTQRVVVGGPSGLQRRDVNWTGFSVGSAVLMAPAVAGAGWEVTWPRLCLSPDGSGRYFYTWLETWTGTVSGSRYWLAATSDVDTVGEALIFDQVWGKGWDLFVDGGVWYAVSPVGVYSAPLYSGTATQRKDLGADVAAFDLMEEGEDKPARGRVWLNNADGRYATPGTGTYAMLREGSRVCLGLGYTTSAGVETVWLPPLWVERWAHVVENGESWLVLELGDAWSYLERCRSRYQVTYTGLTVGAIAAKLCRRVSSTALANVAGMGVVTAATWTLRPGDSVGVALRRLLREAGARLRFGTTAVSGDPGHWDAVTVTAVALGSGASGYSFGSASHPILASEYGDRGQRVNLVEVYGLGAWDYAFDLAHEKAAGHCFVEKSADWVLDSAADVDDRAGRLLFEEQRKLSWGWVEALPHFGAELHDVVDVTDSRASLTAAPRRVVGIRWRYDSRKRGLWIQRLELGAV